MWFFPLDSEPSSSPEPDFLGKTELQSVMRGRWYLPDLIYALWAFGVKVAIGTLRNNNDTSIPSKPSPEFKKFKNHLRLAMGLWFKKKKDWTDNNLTYVQPMSLSGCPTAASSSLNLGHWLVYLLSPFPLLFCDPELWRACVYCSFLFPSNFFLSASGLFSQWTVPEASSLLWLLPLLRPAASVCLSGWYSTRGSRHASVHN